MSATSPTSGLSTPVHLSSDSLVNQGAPNHYPASEQLDFDEAIDVSDDHVTTADGGGGVADNGHVTQRMKLSLSDESTEEGRDSVPNYESTTTDNIIDSLEPVDYIESNPRLHAGAEIRYHANGGLVGNHGNGAGPSLPYHRYENWSVLDQIDDGSKKGRVVKRNKGSRVAKVERQRAPYPLPRPGKVKSIHSRPSPLSRKRRYSGRVVRPPLQPPNASEETDMAQADEMGEGEGRDDGFIDGAMQEPFKRRSKKRTGGIHSLLPSLGHGSPQSSPSTTPVSRRKISTRKSRLKPRTRRHSKPQLASADISTQESTTQGPCSSDTSEARLSQDEVGRPGPGGGGGGEDLGSDSDGDYEDTRSITPNPRDVGVVRAELVKLRNGGLPSLAHRDQVSDIQPPPVTVMSSKDDSLGGSASDNNLHHDSNETSDTDLTPLPRTHTHQHWANKKFESDLSTAPFSSETSDMETSGNERIFTTDGGSATDLNPKPSPDSPPIPSSFPSPMGKVSTRQVLSGSSGDEVKKNKLSVKSKPISKPSPPPKKVSTVEPSSAGKPSSSAGKPSAVVKKPLHATKSSPLGNKAAPVPLKSQRSEGSNNPSRSKSIKVNIPAKPKPPPVPAKPASKPDLKPKPMKSASVHHSPSRSGHTSSQKAKFEGKPRANSVQEPESSAAVMRKIHSDTDLGAAKVVVRRSPTMAARKLTLVKEETAERRQSTPPRPNPPSAPLKPTVPLKPRRQQQQSSEGKAKPGEKAPEKKGKSTESAQSVKQSTTKSKESPPSDSSKTASSSEVTTSGPSQSPSVSPYTSPSLSKRLSTSGSKPVLLPKKPSVKSHHHRANSDSVRLLRKVEPFDIGSSVSAVSIMSSTTPAREQSTKEGVRKGESKQSVRSSNKSPELPASPTDGATSPPPPPIPPRSKVAGRKSSHLELVIPVSDPGSVRSSPTPTDSTNRKKLSAPRRPPPSPPSPLPKRATEAQPTSNELIDSNSRMSQSNSRDQPQRPVSMHGRDIHSTHIEDAPPVGPIHQYAVVNKPRAFKISPEKPRSKTPDFLSRDETAIDSDIRKNSDSELEVHSTKKRTKVVRRESSRRAPPKPPKYDTPDETTGYVPVNTDTMSSQQQKLGSQSPRSRSSVSPPGGETTPPPLPAQPIPKRKMSLQKSAATVSERPRLKDPIYDVIPDLPKKTYKKAKHREYEEIDLIDGELPPGLIKSAKETPTKEVPTESIKSAVESPVEPIKSPVELVRTVSEALPHKQTQKQPQGNYAQLPIEDLRENWKTSPQMRRRAAKSFSCKKSQSLMYRRFSSERLAQRSKLLTIDASPSRRKSLVHRTPSLDRLDDRMGRSLRYSMHYCQDSSSSDDEDMMTGIASPVSAALPKPPSDKSLYSSPKSQRTKQGKSVGGGTGYFVPPDVEPLYQYINTAEFLRETSDPMIPPPPPSSTSTSTASRLPVPPGAPGQPKQNQLEIARQLSQRKLWCEQPEVITSGILMSLSDEEKKLQEAMFEVISSEATYLRSLDVLIDHFMDDPGMNPNLPEGRRVLDKRQHHVIFSNVREVRDVSARFLSDLQLRQKESPVVKNISDIILDYAENHFECYVRYCTNQIYQTRELHDCIENNVMFREYLKRLESKKICQNLNMQSFLLLPMQRITRLPLLILAILNRTPLDYPDQSLVESTLRNVQKLVTACNDGARKMERTEQLHEIHKKLYFGKLKPFPLVSVSRQLERRGTLVLLQVEQKLFGKRKITKKPLYLFVFTDYVIIAKKKKDPKGDYLYKVVDHASRAVVEVENVETLSGMTFPKPVLGDQDPITEAMWAVSVAGSKHAFLLMLLDNVHRQTGRYLLLASNDTDKTRWLDSLSRQDVEREDEKIYQTWDCPQVQAVFDYKAQQPDELDLQRGDVVKVYRKMADGWYEGERLRDLQCGWFPSNFTMEIQNEHTRARNLRETHRLNSLLAANDMILSCVQQNPR